MQNACRDKGIRGAVYTEALVAVPLLVIFILCAVQIGFIWEAKIGARYSAFCAARAAAVHNGDLQKAERAAYLALLPVMPRISGVISDTLAKGEVAKVIGEEVDSLVQTFATGRFEEYVSGYIKNFSTDILKSASGILNIEIPLPYGFSTQLFLKDIVPDEWVTSVVEDIVKPAGKVATSLNEIFSFSKGGKYSVFLEKYLTARFFTRVEIVDGNGGPIGHHVSPGTLIKVKVHVFYPLVVPGARRLVGRRPQGLPDNAIAQLLETTGTGFFSHIVETTFMRVECCDEGTS